MSSPKSTPKNPPSQDENEWLEWLKTLGFVFVITFGIRTFIAQAFHIPSQSMEPTLQIGDRLFVYKLSYMASEPEREDIIVFQAPETAQTVCRVPPSDFIKRVIGLPGEEVEVRDGQVYINGEPLSEPYINEPPAYDWGPEVIPPNSVLVFGDNRNNSCDGHAWGMLSDDQIIGRAVLRYWPPNRIGGL